MTPDDLYDDFVRGFPGRKFSAGLLVAFIDFLLRLGAPTGQYRNLDELLAVYPRQEFTSAGKHANTLIVATESGTVSLRPFYNAAERFFRAEHKRFDYPSCAPHATQAWADYRSWLDALCTFSQEQLYGLRERVQQYVLESLESQAFDPESVSVEPPLFRRILETFDPTAQKGEPTGAAFQGIVFGFLRADNPHLQIEIDKVRTGSKRLQRIADIDGWEGSRLAISAEVKQYTLSMESVPDLAAFANEVSRRGALGVVAALGFAAGVREELEVMGVKPLDVDDLLRVVELWDPVKQRTAVASFVYYVNHVEKNSSLARRLQEFIEVASKPVPPPDIAP